MSEPQRDLCPNCLAVVPRGARVCPECRDDIAPASAVVVRGAPKSGPQPVKVYAWLAATVGLVLFTHPRSLPGVALEAFAAWVFVGVVFSKRR